MRTCLYIILIFLWNNCYSQSCAVFGKITDEFNVPLTTIEVHIKNAADSALVYSGKDGHFSTRPLAAGPCYIFIAAKGYEEYHDTIMVCRSDTAHPGAAKPLLICLHHTLYMLDEVKIVQKVMAMTQKDDTTEFNGAAYKVNPDADAADLVKKMPSISINGSQVTAQGETVTKVMVDGKPFFGSDPYAALKNLPADIIDKVQVYNEKSDQEQFSGFSEGLTTKTINIVTQADKRQGFFGKAYAGAGPSDPPGGSQQDVGGNTMYGAGSSVNIFNNDRRLTLTAQANNVNIQNFTGDNNTAQATGGLATTNAGGVSYADKWGRKTDVSLSYMFNATNSSSLHDTHRTYFMDADSGQVYDADGSSASKVYNHRLSMRLAYVIDSMNSVLLQPQLSVRKSYGSAIQYANTEEDAVPLNQTYNTNQNNITGLNFANNLLLKHKFHKKGRTISLNLNTGNNGSNGDGAHTAQNLYFTSPLLNDTLNQLSRQTQSTWNLSSNAAYTEPAGKHGMLKLEYNLTYIPATAGRNTYDYSPATGAYSARPDNLFSNDFTSSNTAHRTGASYQLKVKKAEFTVGFSYQLSLLSNTQQLPAPYTLRQQFGSILPVASLHYKISKHKNFQFSYNTSTTLPAVGQLQNALNNADPLHLYSGNPFLKEPYTHSLAIRYNSTAKDGKNNFSAVITAGKIQHAISDNSIIAAKDTTIQQFQLAQGAQFTMPVNINGAESVNADIGYGRSLSAIKCQLNTDVFCGITRTPAIINNQLNVQDNEKSGITLSLTSNISENIDFTISSGAGVTASNNSLNSQLNNTYLNTSTKATANIIIWNGIVFNTSVAYLSNSGLAAGYDQDYMLCNASVGKKIFKHHKGDIRLSGVDLLNQNNNIQHTITDTYIQDMRSNMVQRYFLLTFTYKLSEFGKADDPENASARSP